MRRSRRVGAKLPDTAGRKPFEHHPRRYTRSPRAGLIEVSAANLHAARIVVRQNAKDHRHWTWSVSLSIGDRALSKDHVMTQYNILGLVALAVGALLLFFGWRASIAPADQLTEALTGRFTGNTMWYLIAGAASAVAGIALLARGYIRG